MFWTLIMSGQKSFNCIRVQKGLGSSSIHVHWLEAKLRKFSILPVKLVVLASRPPSSQHVTSDGGRDGETQYQHDLAWDRAPPAASVSEPLVTCYATLTTRKHKISVSISLYGVILILLLLYVIWDWKVTFKLSLKTVIWIWIKMKDIKLEI